MYACHLPDLSKHRHRSEIRILKEHLSIFPSDFCIFRTSRHHISMAFPGIIKETHLGRHREDMADQERPATVVVAQHSCCKAMQEEQHWAVCPGSMPMA